MEAENTNNYQQLKAYLLPYWHDLSPSERKKIMKQFERSSKYNTPTYTALKESVERIKKRVTNIERSVEKLSVSDTAEIDVQDKISHLQQNDHFLSSAEHTTLCYLVNFPSFGIEEKRKVLHLEQKIQKRKNSELARDYPQLFDGNEPYLRYLIQPINQILGISKITDELVSADISSVVDVFNGKSEKYEFKLDDLTKLLSLRDALSSKGFGVYASSFLEDKTYKAFEQMIDCHSIETKKGLMSWLPIKVIENYITTVLNRNNGALKKMMRNNQKFRKNGDLIPNIMTKMESYDGKYAPISVFNPREIQAIDSDDELSHLVINKREKYISQLPEQELARLLGESKGGWYDRMPNELKQLVDEIVKKIVLGKMQNLSLEGLDANAAYQTLRKEEPNFPFGKITTLRYLREICQDIDQNQTENYS